MTPEQKIKYLWLTAGNNTCEYLPEEIEKAFDDMCERDEEYECVYVLHDSGVPADDIPAPYSRHYECDMRAAKLPDNTWVAWPYWHGGGKHGEPISMPILEYAVDVVHSTRVQTIDVFKVKQ